MYNAEQEGSTGAAFAKVWGDIKGQSKAAPKKVEAGAKEIEAEAKELA